MLCTHESYFNVTFRNATVHNNLSCRSVRPLRFNTHTYVNLLIALQARLQSRCTLEPIRISLQPISALYANTSRRREGGN